MSATDDRFRPLFMISIAAELAEMHPQTLRLYERKGLIRPKRSTKHTRLYSMDDVERLRRIQQLTSETGLNLAGVERVLELEQSMLAMQRQVERLEADLDAAMRAASDQVEQVHRSYRRELVRVPSREVVVRVGRTRP
jgi:MerR family transcriptional regulator, heat shock protein HspR